MGFLGYSRRLLDYNEIRAFSDFSTYSDCTGSRKRTPSPVRLVLEDSTIRSFMLIVVVSLQLGSII